MFVVKENLYIIAPILAYILSPVLLNSSHYLYVYCCLPWYLYFLTKIIKNNELKYKYVIAISILIFISSINLPNPKYIFHMGIIFVLFILLGIYLKIICFKFIHNNLNKIALLVLINFYLILPQVIFLIFYSPTNYDIHTRLGYKDEGVLMDYGEATALKLLRLYKDSLNLNSIERLDYVNSPFINFSSYFIFFIFLYTLYKNKKPPENIYIIYSILIVVYLLLAFGSNPPLGFVYQYLITNINILAFLRTTAGANFYLSVFLCLAIYSIINNQSKKIFQNIAFIFLILIISIRGYPILNGEIYKNVKVTSPSTDKQEHGIQIPGEYFEVSKILNFNALDSKVVFLSPQRSYISTSWGYFGAPFYDFLYKSSNLDCVNFSGLSNIFFIVEDKTIEWKNSCPILESYLRQAKKIYQGNFLNVFTIDLQKYLPHFYVPREIKFINNADDYPLWPQIGSEKSIAFIADSQKILLKNFTTTHNSTVEYKKINPTKYILRIHGATGIVPLVFLENFHPGWAIFLSKFIDQGQQLPSDYRMLDESFGTQATKSEITSYLLGGLLSVGSKDWLYDTVTSEYPSHSSFISKIFYGTIQNNYLINKGMFETIFLKKLNDDHINANKKNNAWLINVSKLCDLNASYCRKNKEGTWDIELVVEFTPQKYFYIGLIISLAALFLSIILALKKYRARTYEK